MRKIIVTANVTLDGVMQAPHGSDEDSSGDFNYGGWTSIYADASSGKAVQKEMNHSADYLLGRKTFELWAGFWPSNGKMWPAINDHIKYVLSKTIKDPAWENTVVLENLEDIKQVKNSEGRDLQVWGSSELTHLLLENGLVDELHLRISPILVGKGKKLFDNNTVPTLFTMTEHIVTPKGIIIVSYQNTGPMSPTSTVENIIDKYLKSHNDKG